MDEEAMPITLKACHHRRGSYQAQVTKATQKVTRMIASGIELYQILDIDLLLGIIQSQVTPSRDLHEMIMTSFAQPDKDLAAEQKAASTFEDAVTEQIEKLTRMRAEAGLFQELTSLLQDIKDTSSEAPDKHAQAQATEFKRIFGAHCRSDLTTIQHNPTLTALRQSVKEALRVLSRKVADAMAAAELTAAASTRPATRDDRSDDRERDAADARRREITTHRLPRIELPTFTGDFLEWHAFWSVFQRNVHDNPDLQEAEKVAYLRKAIQDDSRPNLVDTSSAVPGCYEGYVTSLKERYDRKRRIHAHHTKTLFSCKPCKDSSANELTRVHTTVNDAVKKLQFTGQFTAETIVTAFAEGLLPPDLWEQWNLAEGDPQIVPDVHKLLQFMERRANLAQLKASDLGARNWEPPVDRTRYARRTPVKPEDTSTRRQNYATTQGRGCLLCKEEQHPLFHCEVFKGMPVDERADYVRQRRLCFNCLSHGHQTRDCISIYRCKRCGKAHHSTLHRGPVDEPNESPDTEQRVSAAAEVVNRGVHSPGVFIPTLLLKVHAPDNRSVGVRAMLDSGSTISLIKASVARKLNLKLHQTSINIIGVQGATTGRSNALVRFTLRSNQVAGVSLDMTAYVVDTVAGTLPDKRSNQVYQFLDTITLADPGFNTPNQVDLILGNDILDDVVKAGTIRGSQEFPRATNTLFGWVVEGRMDERELPAHHVDPPAAYCAHVTKLTAAEETLAAQREANDMLKTFWELEAVPQVQALHTPDEMAALQHFDETHRITTDGRFEVSLPRRDSTDQLGSSRGRALKRFLTNEASLIRRGKWEQFQSVLQEYFTLEHAEPVPAAEFDSPSVTTYYMPMHAVLKAASTTTKLRVVFDASAATSTGISLNDTLMVGPTVQKTLSDILIRFRTHRVGVCADISKMYRAIKLAPEEKDYHRFLWRRQPTDPVTDHRMRRVTFGVAASPFVATKVLHQIATNAMHSAPEAAGQILNSFYVDDFLSGAATHDLAATLCEDVRRLLGNHGLELRKWRSNSPGFLGSIPSELIETIPDSTSYGPDDYPKALGLHWDSGADHFFVSTSQLRLPVTLTKRLLASDIHSTFDVLGWLTPVTLRMKVLLQGLWEERLDWDEVVPQNIQEDWSAWRRELPELAAIPIPRHYFRKDSDPRDLQLHGFADASISAYAAAIYVRAEYPDQPPSVTLVTAKSRVAPLKPLTIPRLELCGAHLLAQLMTTVRRALDVPIAQVSCWTDSTIVLNWLDGSARRYKTYVANRIVNTLELIPTEHWHHVPTTSNPADCASRGVLPSELQTHPLWWSGPPWLHEDPIRTPPQPGRETETTERKLVAHIRLDSTPWLEERFSTYERVRRVASWMLRFIRQAQPTSRRPSIGTLTTQDVDEAENLLYKRSQHRTFGHGPGQGEDSPGLKALHPFRDPHQLLRVGGRLGNSELQYAQAHPIILHSRDRLTKLLIQHVHQITGHAGPNLMLARLSDRYHLIGAMAQIKATCHNCIRCKRLQAKAAGQLMGQLPAHRVKPNKPFTVVGIDYAGPLLTKYAHVRKPVIVKAYICIYVCMITRAIHLEVVSDLTTGAFLACFERFVARRGKPHDIYSDNGGNFVGAAKQLEGLLIPTPAARESVNDHCVSRGMTWHFSPERAPHFGGMWEAGVKSMKFHLRRIMGDTRLTFEELSTVICRIESILNSRPLVRVYSHSEEGVEALTPGHFLIGRPLEALPTRLAPPTTSLTRRWNLCQQLTGHFWERWSKEYLVQLQKRHKWTKTHPNIKTDDIVLMKDDGLFTQEWPLARVIRTFPGKDGLVRVVLVRAKNAIYKRPVAKLVMLLPSEDPDSSQDGENGAHPVLGGGMLESQEVTPQEGEGA